MNLQKLLVQSLVWRGCYFLSTLLVNVFLSRYLQASATGVIYFLSGIFSFSLIIFSFSLESGVTYFASGNKIHPSKLVWLSFAWSAVLCLLSLAGVAAYLAVDETIPANFRQQCYFFAVCYLAGLFLTNCSAALFYARDNFFLPNLFFTAWNIILVLFIPWHTVAASLDDAVPVLNGYFLVFLLQGASVAIAFVIRHGAFRMMRLPAATELVSIFRYSAIAMMANMVFFLVYRIDYLFVKASPVCTDADLGNYIQVSKLGQMLLIVPQIIASVIFPRTASGLQRQELNTAIMIMARLLLQLYAMVFIVVLVAGNALFTWLFGHTFNTMQVPFLVLIPGIFALSVLTLLSAYFSGKGKVRVNMIGAILALIAVVIGDYLFVPVYGIVAAAAVSTVGYGINLGYSLFVFYKDYDINVVDFFRWRKSDYHWLKELLVHRRRP